MTSTDALLRRIEITSAIVCLVFALVALIITRGRLEAGLAVMAGGVLVAVSYYTIKSAANVVAAAVVGGGAATRMRRRFAWAVVRIAVRYALLAFLAYVMISRLRLHPLGLLAGASSVVAAVSVEALRLLVKKS